MPVLDFKQIPEANKATGEQDTFELFARDFLEYLGYKIILGPDRGPDGGRDLIGLELRRGVGGETAIRWLVSCKHFSHSGKSVTPSEEDNILDRVSSKGCHGFLGFYSTLPSASLTGRLEGLKAKIEYQIFDREKIEKEILTSSEGLNIAERYFPASINIWKQENPKPAELFEDQKSLYCEFCEKDLLEPIKTGIVVIMERFEEVPSYSNRFIANIYWCCKGNCDKNLKKKYYTPGVVDGWADISDICIPSVYLSKWIIGTINNLFKKDEYSDDAFNKLKDLLITIFPYISRHLTSREEEQLNNLFKIPSYLGGLGQDY